MAVAMGKTPSGGRRTGTIASGARQFLLQTNSVVRRVGLTRAGAATPLATVQLGAAQPLIAHPMQNYATGQRAEVAEQCISFCGSWACVLLQKFQRDAERALPLLVGRPISLYHRLPDTQHASPVLDILLRA